MYSKIHKTNGFALLACCDKELAGKKISGNGLEIEVKEKFYNGKATSAAQFKKLLKETDSANLIGKKCVGIAVKEGFIKENAIIKINGVPHVQIYRL